MKINTDPENETHVTILNLAQNKEKVEVFVGWADGTVAPTLQGDVVAVPQGRSWTQFQAQLRKGPPIFDKDSLVNHTIPMKRQTPAF
ncbi:phage tail tube protein, partial [Acinetobacter baumannii]